MYYTEYAFWQQEMPVLPCLNVTFCSSAVMCFQSKYSQRVYLFFSQIKAIMDVKETCIFAFHRNINIHIPLGVAFFSLALIPKYVCFLFGGGLKMFADHHNCFIFHIKQNYPAATLILLKSRQRKTWQVVVAV